MNARPPDDGPFSGAGAVLAIAASAAMLLIAGTLVGAPHAANASAIDGTWHAAVLLLPLATVLALAFAGFRRSAAAVAILVAPVVLFYFGVVTLLTLSGTFALVVLVHALLLIAALLELRSWDTAFFRARPMRRVIGAAIALTIWVTVSGAVGGSERTAATRHVEAVEQKAVNARLERNEQARAWMHHSNIADLTSVAACIERYRGGAPAGHYPRSLDTVVAWAARAPGASDNCNWVFAHADPAESPLARLSPRLRIRYVPPAGRADPWRSLGFALEVESVWDSVDEPVLRDEIGTRSYLLDSSGALHVTAEHRRATVVDPTLPPCTPFDATGATKCALYVPRQRWGMTSQLPVGGFHGRDSVRVGDTAPFWMAFRPSAPPDSVRRFDVDWDERGATTAVVVPTALSWPRPTYENNYPLTHVFADSGRHVLRATLITRDGTAYQYADTLRTYLQLRIATTGVDSAGRLLAGGIGPQTRQALANLRDSLERAGSSIDRIQDCTIRLVDLGDWQAARRELAAFVQPAHAPPASPYIDASLRPGVRVGLDCLAPPIGNAATTPAAPPAARRVP